MIVIFNSADIVMGIDPSINGTGIAIRKNGKIIYTAKINFKNSKNPHYLIEDGLKKPKKIEVPFKELRGLKASEIIVKLIKKHKVNKVIMEDYAFSANSRARYQIGEFVGSIKNSIYKLGLLPDVISIKKAKKIFTGNGNASKEEVKNKVYLKYGIDAENFDISDAIMLASIEKKEV